ncbi:lipocalin family protein [Mucilaginibacter celer]|uniref:Lipocalin-like domain-containing protein n=1 Tax=Mucilaginibacter celer TaxID=2305508 RepID=A0A494VQY1_9SPHI|nr:lipocalin family protein [Mucilaginibacter celer]AYL96411.1 hypothetical protein HYN43_014380 [Mucilaginibacter celer]
MRLSKYLLVLLLPVLCMFACSKDKNAAEPAPGIVGKWYLKKYQTRTYKNEVLVKDTSRANYTPADFEVFGSDGSGYTSNFTPSGETALIQYKYTLNGNVLVINRTTPAFYEGTYTVITLTNSSLEVSYESSITLNGDHYRGIDNISFKRE